MLPQAEEAIGLTMDESLQLHPEQSTTALVIYHPEARYFSLRTVVDFLLLKGRQLSHEKANR
jgi:Vitamin B12 dependent methionine synthase, activation domain